jgi:cytochrome c oxidase subunit 3
VSVPAAVRVRDAREPVQRRLPLLVVGIILFIGSELMFFSSLFGMYFTLRAQSSRWTPEDIKVDFVRLFFTLVLLGSSATMQMGVHRLKQGNVAAFKRWTWLTWLMGAAFLGAQGHEWATVPFQISTNAYGSAFFAMTGFHGLHVFGGLMVILVILGRAGQGAYSAENHAGVEVATYYWHFVDFVWIGLFSTIFIVR